ncbi:MAG: helix-turn-helix domain-containing protein [Candidatus Methanomethylophilaceae archaeon]|jgi:putative transcriptional regulator|nr:helix-turn-helix domain-containing protein [Candidatus Methanomethylophilaceae archaeon]MBR3476601.1 helix-turn-helix domain-containing protein [Candidatus Methanomethylophilaceae archaeon]MBR4181985.1 helix-turn-helix domain-containing protein [Candidatus Methanomethylophilaceae archaeon]MBR4217012.1 helix-turn-helix domain-containing protein [Candidatus Methanomethylophilaceae archaeon]MBR4697646.1 helix-turn-helix domain-containing protein [Candidatus Methanomethylophilaceae archaeon]
MVDEFKQRIAGEIALSPNPGRTIKKWREEFGLSQHQLADAMGVSHSVISDYESGRRKSPGVNVVKKMVEAFVELDLENGSQVISRYNPEFKLECITSMDEFPGGADIEDFIEAISGRNLNPDLITKKMVYGYTIVDSVKAILSLGSQDYLKIYGGNIERALIFTNVHFGRSPMIAVRAHPLTPAMVVYQKPEKVDPLAVKLAHLERIPLVVTDLSVSEIVASLNAFKEE